MRIYEKYIYRIFLRMYTKVNFYIRLKLLYWQTRILYSFSEKNQKYFRLHRNIHWLIKRNLVYL